MVRTQISLEPSQMQALRLLARRRDESLAAVVRQAVDELVARENRSMALERLLQRLGSHSSGQNDIARDHDRYLAEIYGE